MITPTILEELEELEYILGDSDKPLDLVRERRPITPTKPINYEAIEIQINSLYIYDRQGNSLVDKTNEHRLRAIESKPTYLEENGRRLVRTTSHDREGLIVVHYVGELSEEQVDEILETLSMNGRRIRKASRQLDYSRNTVRRYGRMHGVLKIRKNKLDIEQQSKVIVAHSTYGGNAGEASRHLGHSRGTIIRYWRQADLEIRFPNNLTQEQLVEVTNAYQIYHGSAFEAAKHLPYNPSTFLKHWKRAGFKIKSPGLQYIRPDGS